MKNKSNRALAMIVLGIAILCFFLAVCFVDIIFTKYFYLFFILIILGIIGFYIGFNLDKTLVDDIVYGNREDDYIDITFEGFADEVDDLTFRFYLNDEE